MISQPKLCRAVTTALVLLDVKSHPIDWFAGPLPNSWRAATGKPVEGTIRGRIEYVNSGIEDTLYRREGRTLLRWHTIKVPPAPSSANATLEALELLKLPFKAPFPNGILIMHFRFDPSMRSDQLQRSLNYLTNHNRHHVSGARTWVSSLTAPWATINRHHRRSQHITLLTRASPQWPPITKNETDSDTRTSQWLFSLSTSGRYRPDPASIGESTIDSPESSQVWMSENLRGAVSRDGFVMLGLKEDDGGAGGRFGFDYDGAEFFARGLYTDVLALSTIQRIALDALEYDLGQLYSHRASPAELLALENELSVFRTRIWRQDFAPQGSQERSLD